VLKQLQDDGALLGQPWEAVILMPMTLTSFGEQSQSVYKRRSQGQRGELKGVFLPPTEREDTFFGSEASVVNIPAGPGARPTMIQSFQSIHHTLLAFLTSHYCHVRAISCHHVALLHFSYAFRTFVSHLWPGPDPKSRLHFWCSEALNERDTLSLLHRSRGALER
jgi:hypothetical protein